MREGIVGFSGNTIFLQNGMFEPLTYGQN